MDAQRKAQVHDPVDHPLVQVDHEPALLGRFAGGQPLDELLLGGHGGIAGVLNQPADQADAAFDLRHEAERQQNFGPVIGGLRELGEKIHDRVGVQQLRHAVIGALVALEVEAAVLTLAGGNQDDTAVGHQLAVDGQGVGRRHTGALAVVHGARDADEHHAIHTGGAQLGQPLPQGGLVREGGDLRAQAVDARQLRLDGRPEVEHVELRLHRDRSVVVLCDHARDHHVPETAVQAGFGGELDHLPCVLEGTLATVVAVRWHQLERDGVEAHAAPLHQTTCICACLCARRPHGDARTPSPA